MADKIWYEKILQDKHYASRPHWRFLERWHQTGKVTISFPGIIPRCQDMIDQELKQANPSTENIEKWKKSIKYLEIFRIVVSNCCYCFKCVPSPVFFIGAAVIVASHAVYLKYVKFEESNISQIMEDTLKELKKPFADEMNKIATSKEKNEKLIANLESRKIAMMEILDQKISEGELIHNLEKDIKEFKQKYTRINENRNPGKEEESETEEEEETETEEVNPEHVNDNKVENWESLSDFGFPLKLFSSFASSTQERIRESWFINDAVLIRIHSQKFITQKNTGVIRTATSKEKRIQVYNKFFGKLYRLKTNINLENVTREKCIDFFGNSFNIPEFVNFLYHRIIVGQNIKNACSMAKEAPVFSGKECIDAVFYIFEGHEIPLRKVLELV